MTRERKSFSTALFTVLLLVLLDLRFSPAPGEGQTRVQAVLVTDLIVEGNRRVQEAVIRSRIKTKIGTPFNPVQLSDDTRAVFGLGFFEDVRTRVEDFEGGVRLIFDIEERAFVRDIDFTGNRQISAGTLRKKIDLKASSDFSPVYNPMEIQRAREKLTKYYEEQGYSEAEVTAKPESLPDGDVRVVFAIVEGRGITIDQIIIRGNRAISDEQVKAVMQLQEHQPFLPRGMLQRQKLEEDVERIVSLYNDHGFVEARVPSAGVALDRDRASATITIQVVEGPQHRIGSVGIKGVALFPESEMHHQLRLITGDVFSPSRLRDALRRISDLYSNIGRASADVVGRTERRATPPSIDIMLEVTEGPEVYIERITISSQTGSYTHIVRREMGFAEGDLFTLQKLVRARQRLLGLGHFETVNMSTGPGSNRAKIVINVELIER